jgi:hypothetical protein
MRVRTGASRNADTTRGSPTGIELLLPMGAAASGNQARLTSPALLWHMRTARAPDLKGPSPRLLLISTTATKPQSP